METILKEYESTHGTRNESYDPLAWDNGYEVFMEGWISGIKWMGNVDDKDVRSLYDKVLRSVDKAIDL